MAKIVVISSSLVGSNSNPISRLELTPWDLLTIRLGPIQRGLLFHKPESQKVDDKFIQHLKNSLSRTLNLFPPLAGRLSAIDNDDNTTCFFVDCNNAGVEFVHAVARDVSLTDILEPKCVPQELVSSFFRLNGVRNFEGISKPLMGVQITELLDGLFIAVSINHTVVDGISFWHFFNCWSEISRGFDTISKPPVFDRWFSTPIPLPPLEKILSESYVKPSLVTWVFQISKESLAKLKAKANSEAGTDKISSLQALSAHLWRSYTRCRGGFNDSTTRCAVVVGARGRIPLQEGYFGNAVMVAETAGNKAELLQKGLGYAALKINEVIAEQTKERVVKWVEDWVKNPLLVNGRVFQFSISSSPRYDVYGNDFGWGKPIGVRGGNMLLFNGNVVALPSAVDGGIEVHACLTLETLKAMEDDAEFMEAFTL